MIRICPERDLACPAGMTCPYADSQYGCKPGWQQADAGHQRTDVIDTIRTSAALGEWTDTSTLTPAEATARCEAVRVLVEAAQSCIRASPECLCLDEMTAALAPFTKGSDK